MGDLELAGIDGGVGHGQVVGGGLGGGLARHQVQPVLMGFLHNIGGVLLVLGLAGEGKLVLGLAIGDLVDAEPLDSGAEKAGEVALNVLDIVELGGEGIVDIDRDDLPVGLSLIQKGYGTEDLDLLDLAGEAYLLSDLANVDRVVITAGLGIGVDEVGIFPGLEIRCD